MQKIVNVSGALDTQVLKPLYTILDAAVSYKLIDNLFKGDSFILYLPGMDLTMERTVNTAIHLELKNE